MSSCLQMVVVWAWGFQLSLLLPKSTYECGLCLSLFGKCEDRKVNEVRKFFLVSVLLEVSDDKAEYHSFGTAGRMFRYGGGYRDVSSFLSGKS